MESRGNTHDNIICYENIVKKPEIAYRHRVDVVHDGDLKLLFLYNTFSNDFRPIYTCVKSTGNIKVFFAIQTTTAAVFSQEKPIIIVPDPHQVYIIYLCLISTRRWLYNIFEYLCTYT